MGRGDLVSQKWCNLWTAPNSDIITGTRGMGPKIFILNKCPLKMSPLMFKAQYLDGRNANLIWGHHENPLQRAWKWAPTWYICMVAPKFLSRQPNSDLIQRLDIKGFWRYHTDISSGGLFGSSLKGCSHGNLWLDWHFSPFKYFYLNYVPKT